MAASMQGNSTSMKARLMISDGTHAAIAILHSAIYDKLELGEGQELSQFDIIKIKKCVIKKVGKEGTKQQFVVVFTEPIKIVFSGLTAKIGCPRESKNFSDTVPPSIDLNIPVQDVLRHMDVDEHEVIYA